jgi:hypothetical protein
MAVINTGMDRAQLKKLLVAARKAPVSCALARGDKEAADHCLLLLHKVSPPKVLMATLKKQFPTLRTPCFGIASVDVAADPKLVTFSVNKVVSGMPKRLVRTLKGTGFTKVAIAQSGGRSGAGPRDEAPD